MAKAIAAFHATDPETGESVLYDPEGNPDVPDAVARTVGAHLLDTPVDPDEDNEAGAGFDGAAFDAAVEAKVADLVEDKVADAVEEYKAREQAAYDLLADQDDPFDPSGDKVTADQVRSYLVGLDRDTVNGAAEFDRVVELEHDGKDRASAIPE